MAQPPITITVVDEGYYKKPFRLDPSTTFQKLLETYRSHLCAKCSDPSLLDFWFESTKLTEDHTPTLLSLLNNDIIDIRIAKQCTRGACPIPPEQTLPNLHYLPSKHIRANGAAGAAVEEAPPLPASTTAGPRRIEMSVRDINGAEMQLRTKRTTEFGKMMGAFALQVRRGVGEMRFCVDGLRLLEGQTPEMVDMEDGDLIEVFYEHVGG